MASSYRDISIHAPRTGSDVLHQLNSAVDFISIHAPRTGSDTGGDSDPAANRDFNPRSPHGERPLSVSAGDVRGSDFNPRSPHGERRGTAEAGVLLGGISIHAPRTGSDPQFRRRARGDCISIHAPRTGSDVRVCALGVQRVVFQSTLPARGATIRL